MNRTNSFTKQISRQVKHLANAKEILITGEPGTGKRSLAREIHRTRTKTGQFILLDGRSTTYADLNGILFVKDKDLVFSLTGHYPAKLSNNCTLCIADIDALGPHEQELVRVFLQKHRKEYAGMLVVFTAADATKLDIEVGTFEKVEVPGLRDRTQDLPDIVKSILQSLGKESLTVSPNAIRVLEKSSWPGNIRELANVLGKGALTSKGNEWELPDSYLDERQHLQNAIENISVLKRFTVDDTLWFIEKRLIERLLEVTQNNQSMAANVLNLNEANFRYRLKKFGIPSVRTKT